MAVVDRATHKKETQRDKQNSQLDGFHVAFFQLILGLIQRGLKISCVNRLLQWGNITTVMKVYNSCHVYYRFSKLYVSLLLYISGRNQYRIKSSNCDCVATIKEDLRASSIQKSGLEELLLIPIVHCMFRYSQEGI